MPREQITTQKIHDHVSRLGGDQHPPIPLSSVDRTVHNPRLVRERFGHTFDYLARVELEVDRNVLELLTLLPEVREVDRYFYEDVWQPQEIQHGIILDQVQQDLGMPAAEPLLEVPFNMKVLGALAHMSPVQDIARCMYYLTGASTERQATLAYNDLARYLKEMGEHELAVSVIGQIKRQEPGHFAFYQMSATQILTDGTLKPWQIWTIRSLRDYSYQLVGVDGKKEYLGDMGGVVVQLGLEDELETYAKDIGRLEARILWANKNGMEFPPYFLRALKESVDYYREVGIDRGQITTAA